MDSMDGMDLMDTRLLALWRGTFREVRQGLTAARFDMAAITRAVRTFSRRPRRAVFGNVERPTTCSVAALRSTQRLRTLSRQAYCVIEDPQSFIEEAYRLTGGSPGSIEGSQCLNGNSQRVADGSPRIIDGSRRIIDGRRRITDGGPRVVEGSRRLNEGSRLLAGNSLGLAGESFARCVTF